MLARHVVDVVDAVDGRASATMPRPLTPPTVALKDLRDDKSSTDRALTALTRLMLFGHVTVATVPPILAALGVEPKEEKLINRMVHYLAQLALGDGGAGTPLPLPPSKRGCRPTY